MKPSNEANGFEDICAEPPVIEPRLAVTLKDDGVVPTELPTAKIMILPFAGAVKLEVVTEAVVADTCVAACLIDDPLGVAFLTHSGLTVLSGATLAAFVSVEALSGALIEAAAEAAEAALVADSVALFAAFAALVDALDALLLALVAEVAAFVALVDADVADPAAAVADAAAAVCDVAAADALAAAAAAFAALVPSPEIGSHNDCVKVDPEL